LKGRHDLKEGPIASTLMKLTLPIIVNLAAALFTMVSIGTGVKVAHSIGAGREDQAKVFIHNGILMSFLLGILFIVCPSDKKLLDRFFRIR
jgi:Na+-driven multidrug efflux pump